MIQRWTDITPLILHAIGNLNLQILFENKILNFQIDTFKCDFVVVAVSLAMRMLFLK